VERRRFALRNSDSIDSSCVRNKRRRMLKVNYCRATLCGFSCSTPSTCQSSRRSRLAAFASVTTRTNGWGAAVSCTSMPASRHCRSEEHTSELQSLAYLVCRLLLEKKKKKQTRASAIASLSPLPCTEEL